MEMEIVGKIEVAILANFAKTMLRMLFQPLESMASKTIHQGNHSEITSLSIYGYPLHRVHDLSA